MLIKTNYSLDGRNSPRYFLITDYFFDIQKNFETEIFFFDIIWSVIFAISLLFIFIMKNSSNEIMILFPLLLIGISIFTLGVCIYAYIKIVEALAYLRQYMLHALVNDDEFKKFLSFNSDQVIKKWTPFK